MGSYLSHLECSEPDCGKTYDANVEQHLCECGGILLARYDLDRLGKEVARNKIEQRASWEGLWRHAELLPIGPGEERVSLGEGATPMLPVGWLGEELGVEVWLKEEGLN